jgi:hypothetical protein
LLLSTVGAGACQVPPPRPASNGALATNGINPDAAAPFLDALQERTFRYFWELGDPRTGLVPDRAPTPSFSSIAAVGFGLTAYPIGVERRWVSRAEARRRVLATLDFFINAPQGPEPKGTAGHRGFYYHFLDMDTGHRHQTVELSTIDTTLLLAGALFCQSYFDREDPEEQAIREKADLLFRLADWHWVQPRAPLVAMGWKPEGEFLDHDWRGYNEAMLLYILGLGSPTYPLGPEAWAAWTRTYVWGNLYGQEHVGFGPLFGHQYSHVFVDFRGIKDSYMRDRGIDYFENSRRATYVHRAYAIANPMGWKGYSKDVWGLTACDGPANVTLAFNGKWREFWTYSARGVAPGETVRDDGTVSPSAAGGSLPFAPEIVLPALLEMRSQGERLFSKYGFLDAFNPSFPGGVDLTHGAMRPEGWYDTDYVGIDQGVILAMVENYRSGLIWKVMSRNPHVVRGLRRAGFTGGWLDASPPVAVTSPVPPRPMTAP